MPDIFICCREPESSHLDRLLHGGGFRAETFSGSAKLLTRLKRVGRQGCDAVLLDLRLPEMAELHLLAQISGHFRDLPLVVVSPPEKNREALEAVRQGAYDYVETPVAGERLLRILDRIVEHRRLEEENRQLREDLHRGPYRSDTIIFRSQAFRDVLDLTMQVADSDVNVLIMGESGTGKELIAGAIHANSPRRGRPFVSLNCAALADTLLESQLFGHVRGAFTGAVMDQKGLLEEADGGTLFLDGIGDVSPTVQAKLLRVTQEKDFIVLGSTRPRRVDVRFVSATSKDLMSEVRAGRFREDLYYRLNVIPISLPPLRERREDIEPLAMHFLDLFCRRMKKEVSSIDPEALQALIRYDWPGNVRELENVIERSVILAREGTISAALLPLDAHHDTPAAEKAPLMATLEEVERRHITAVLRENAFHKSRTAEILGISRKTLDRKIDQYGLSGDRLP